MNNRFQAPLSLAGRILMAIIFIGSGLSKATGFAATVGYIASKGLPMPEAGAAAACLLEVAGGLALVFGWYTRLMAALLAIFTIVAGIVFHGFWAFPPEQLVAQQVHFLKNLCIAGGLLSIVAWGAGPWSLDARTSEE
jgi:putative oxidoreductase